MWKGIIYRAVITKLQNEFKFPVKSNCSQIVAVLTNHNGENDSYIKQSQLSDQKICQIKTAKNLLWNWLVILMPCNSLTNFQLEEKEFCCNLAKRHPYLKWFWESWTIGSISWCYKNQIGIKRSGPFGPIRLLSWF